MSEARKQLDAMLKEQVELGGKRRDIALVLFQRGYTERQVGFVMGINPKSAHAMKTNFSKAGREKWKTGQRSQHDYSSAKLKRVNGQKVLSKFIDLVDKVLEEGTDA